MPFEPFELWYFVEQFLNAGGAAFEEIKLEQNKVWKVKTAK